MRVLVTGVNGFVGKHLARELKKRGLEVVGLGREAQTSDQLVDVLAEYWSCDLMDKKAIAKLPLNNIDAVVNLAGLARVADSFSEREKYMAVNVGVLVNLGEELVSQNFNPKVIAISTGAVYDSTQRLPLTEDSKLADDGSPYVLSKIAMEEAAKQLHVKGLQCVIARPFNHIGPGQEQGFLIPDLFAKLKSQTDVIKTGNLSTKRDYTDVRDVASAYADLVAANELNHEVYNICCGKSVSGQEILDLLCNSIGVKVKAEVDPALLRPNEINDLYGSFQLLHGETGWQPKIPLKQTIKDFVTGQN